jgi:cytochrome c
MHASTITVVHKEACHMTHFSHRAITACFVMATSVIAAVAYGQAIREPTELVDQQHCMFCHTSDAPFLAPSFHQIAERYRGAPNATAMLEHKLRVGGRAHWGDMAMPVSAERGGPPLSTEDAHALIQWVMSQ